MSLYTPSNKTRANLAFLLIGIILSLDVIALIFEFLQHDLLTKISLGYQFSDETIKNNDNRLDFTANLYTIANLISLFTFISWFYRAYNNLSNHLGSVKHKLNWAIWGWFVPIMNLYRPFNIMAELFKKTTAYVQQKSQTPILNSWSLLVGLWWIFWLLRMFASQVLRRMQLNAISVDDWLDYSNMGIIRSFIAIPAAIITLKVIYDYSKLERHLESIDLLNSDLLSEQEASETTEEVTTDKIEDIQEDSEEADSEQIKNKESNSTVDNDNSNFEINGELAFPLFGHPDFLKKPMAFKIDLESEESLQQFSNVLWIGFTDSLSHNFQADIFTSKYNLSAQEVDINYWFNVIEKRDSAFHDMLAIVIKGTDERLQVMFDGHIEEYAVKLEDWNKEDIQKWAVIRLITFQHINQELQSVIDRIHTFRDYIGTQNKSLKVTSNENKFHSLIIETKAALLSVINVSIVKGIEVKLIVEIVPQFKSLMEELLNLSNEEDRKIIESQIKKYFQISNRLE